MKASCPDCGVAVYKFRDYAEDMPKDAAVVVADDAPVQKSKKLSRKEKYGIAAVAATALITSTIFAYVSAQKPPASVSLAALPAIDQSDATAAQVKTSTTQEPSVPKRDRPSAENINDISIDDFKVEKVTDESVTFSLVLVNHGQPSTAYPNLVVHWKKSTASPVVITSDEYAHPNTEFTRVVVTTELHKPPHARGIELKISYGKKA